MCLTFTRVGSKLNDLLLGETTGGWTWLISARNEAPIVQNNFEYHNIKIRFKIYDSFGNHEDGINWEEQHKGITLTKMIFIRQQGKFLESLQTSLMMP